MISALSIERPMDPPSGMLFYMDYIQRPEVKIEELKNGLFERLPY